jgi:uncharacterized protein (DUF1015 family)
MSGPKADRLQLLRATHLNPSPIWVLHRDPIPPLGEAWATALAREPWIRLTWRGERHRIWRLDDQHEQDEIERAFADGPALYIADGHHRYETSLAFAAEAGSTVRGATGVLATVTWAEDPGLHVVPTHRLLQVDPSAVATLLDQLLATARVTRYPFVDAPELLSRLAAAGPAPSFALYRAADLASYVIVQIDGTPPGLPADRSAAWRSLDVSLLHALVVEPLVEPAPDRDAALRFDRDPAATVAAVRAGEATLAAFLNPTPVAGVLAVADARDRMPEKSTYFTPKPPAGLIMRDLDAPS